MADLNISNDIGSRCIADNSLGSGRWLLCFQQRLNLLYSGSKSARLGSTYCNIQRGQNIRYKHENWGNYALNRSSRALTYPRLGPLFLRTSSYAQSWPSLVQVAHCGLLPSHLSFLLRHIIHAKRFGLGTSALLGGCGAWLACPSLPCTFTVTLSPISPAPSMGVSVSGDEDISYRTGPSEGGKESLSTSGSGYPTACWRKLPSKCIRIVEPVCQYGGRGGLSLAGGSGKSIESRPCPRFLC